MAITKKNGIFSKEADTTMTTMTAEQLRALRPNTYLKVRYEDGTTKRAVVESTGCIFEFAYGCKRKGYRYSPEQYVKKPLSIEVKETQESKEKAWHHRIERAIICLDKSGFWPDMIEKLANLDVMIYAEKKEIAALYWQDTISRFSTVPTKEQVEKFNKEFREWYGEYIDKYPFVFPKDKNGLFYVDTYYIYEISECTLKCMYFGTSNAAYKKKIKEAIKEHSSLSLQVRVSYDVSFQYDSEKNAAYYREEYRNCGNGHYYVALNENVALFVEND